MDLDQDTAVAIAAAAAVHNIVVVVLVAVHLADMVPDHMDPDAAAVAVAAAELHIPYLDQRADEKHHIPSEYPERRWVRRQWLLPRYLRDLRFHGICRFVAMPSQLLCRDSRSRGNW